jgi:hypothetical protein
MKVEQPTEQDLKCCANCDRFHFSGDLICRSSYIHEDLINPWLVCDEWEWDKADNAKRLARHKQINYGDSNE